MFTGIYVREEGRQDIDQKGTLESCFECRDLRVLALYFSLLKIIEDFQEGKL